MISNKKNIAFVSTYLPRECGIATFTKDLIDELDKVNVFDNPKIIAINDNNNYKYDNRVIMEIDQYDRDSYIKTAKAINKSDINLVVIEHEYGIFGGEAGEYILDFVENLEIPFVITLHTVLSRPTKKQKEVLTKLGEKSKKIIIMAKNTVPILEKVYGVNPSKTYFIHHGVPYRILEPREKMKEKKGFKDRYIISTFGLISPGKGLEYGIEAISKVVKEYDNILYLILGQTHPCIKRKSGEIYREKLMNLVDRLGIKEYVWFIDKYLSKDEIINYLNISDIYMTPYLGKEQAVSGTLAYAIGYGRVTISTPYMYAKEMLSDGRGLLAEFKDSNSLAKNIKYVLDNPEIKREMERKASIIGRSMTWENVSKQYTKIFIDIIGATKNINNSMVI
ncbi:glycosyltransferase family 4 protein [Defluviitalea phaphyphila]|uniref:glycosyltransferase family 4 protein n=1 Tax=Defluviitalea phaphyphila TaxID=1473580 RepID=UPI000730D5BC|nr:glycosyltransferase family 4 protein [Defluviitalea phaphyphila]